MIPIVFVHQGTCEYLEYSLVQAKVSSPNSPIYLLSDVAPSERVPFVTFVNIADFQTTIDTFKRIYVHLCSGADPSFESFCLLRWILIRDFFKSKDICTFFYMDSDVLLFSPLEEIHALYKDCDFTISRTMSGHNSLWNNFQALVDFCDFFLGLYEQRDAALAQSIKEVIGGSVHSVHISDMTFLKLFVDRGKYTVAETTTVIQGTALDNNIIEQEQPYILENGSRKTIWKKGQPYGYRKDTNELVRFHTLHFQGPSKPLLPEYFVGLDGRES